MTYQETLNYLFDSAPMFQQVGKAAYKEGLENTNLLDEHFGHPHRKFRTIHWQPSCKAPATRPDFTPPPT